MAGLMHDPHDDSHRQAPCPGAEQLARWLDREATEAELNGPLDAASDADLETALDAAQAEHLAQCGYCQQRLDEAAASPPWWQAAAEYLAGPEPEQTLTSLVIPAIATSGQDVGDGALQSHFSDQLPADLLQPPSHPELLGRLGRYEIESLIGQGGMGLVFRAFDPQLHRVVALKLLAPQLAANATARERFAREARAVAGLAHPHLVAIHDVVASGPLPYLVMTYIDGLSLEELVRRRGPLPIDQVVQLGRQLAAALATAHEAGLIHRDIKPGNILCEADGQRAVLTDFGLVRTLDDATLTHSGILAGTPHYMAPEQARGTSIGPRADLWGLGAVLYFALTGRPPFDAEHPMAVLHQVCSARAKPITQLRPEVPGALVAIVQRLLEKRPEDRYRDCLSLKLDLDRIASGSTRWQSIGHRWRSRPLRRGAAALAAAGLVWGALAALVYWPSTAPNPLGPATSDSVAAGTASRDDLTTLRSELTALHEANTNWRRQLAELYALTEPSPALSATAGDAEHRGDEATGQLLKQLAPIERASEAASPSGRDAHWDFDSDLRGTFHQLDRLTPATPFASP